MVAKISRGKNLYGALAYNLEKVHQEKGKVLLTSKIIETVDGTFSTDQFTRSFAPYLLANRNTEKPIIHISLNPDPNDKVSDETFARLAQDYMKQMGYGQQAFAVFKHSDLERNHIHIVSVCVDEEGRKISDTFEKRRSMDISRRLEQEYGLADATLQCRKPGDKIFRPVDYRNGDLKSQIAAVVRYLPNHYKFQGIGGYNALLSAFNIIAEEIKGEYNGKAKQGIVYFALNENGEKISNPFKASLFGKGAGYQTLQNHYRQSAEILKSHPAKDLLRRAVTAAMKKTSTESEFKENLIQQNIATVTRRNAEGRLYGITFVDHISKTAWNGSQFGKEFSANVFSELWNNSIGRMMATEENTVSIKESMASTEKEYAVTDNDNIIVSIYGNLSQASPAEDYEELAFENQMKKRSRRRKL